MLIDTQYVFLMASQKGHRSIRIQNLRQWCKMALISHYHVTPCAWYGPHSLHTIWWSWISSLTSFYFMEINWEFCYGRCILLINPIEAVKNSETSDPAFRRDIKVFESKTRDMVDNGSHLL